MGLSVPATAVTLQRKTSRKAHTPSDCLDTPLPFHRNLGPHPACCPTSGGNIHPLHANDNITEGAGRTDAFLPIDFRAFPYSKPFNCQKGGGILHKTKKKSEAKTLSTTKMIEGARYQAISARHHHSFGVNDSETFK